MCITTLLIDELIFVYYASIKLTKFKFIILTMNLDSVFTDNRIRIHEAMNDIWKDLIVDNCRRQMFTEHFNL